MQQIVLIGDIVSSKQLPNRSQVQDKLNAVLFKLNFQRQSRGLLSPYTITLGNEFQAVFDRADWLFLYEIPKCLLQMIPPSPPLLKGGWGDCYVARIVQNGIRCFPSVYV